MIEMRKNLLIGMNCEILESSDEAMQVKFIPTAEMSYKDIVFEHHILATCTCLASYMASIINQKCVFVISDFKMLTPVEPLSPLDLKARVILKNHKKCNIEVCGYLFDILVFSGNFSYINLESDLFNIPEI